MSIYYLVHPLFRQIIYAYINLKSAHIIKWQVNKKVFKREDNYGYYEW